jgi:EmrB/QacA subfamily drug resistance transporter
LLDQPTTRQPTTGELLTDQSAEARANRRLVMAAVLLAIFMVATDSYIVATAMPTIVADLGGFRMFSWVFAAYLLAQAVTIPIYGRLADLYGRKRVFFAGTSVFLLGSLLCGFAWGMVPLVLFRAIEGIGAGAVQPIATTIVGDIYTPVERARMQGYVSGMFGVAAIIGPTLGAFVVEHISWSLVFWVNIPVGIATCVMFGLFLHERHEPRRHRVDYLGSALLMAGVGAPMLAIVQIGNAGRVTVAALMLGGAVALAALAGHERRAVEPMLSLHLWRNRVVAVGCLAGLFNGALMMAISGFLPTFVQGAMGRDATASGVVLAASSVSWAFASMAAGRLMIRTSYRLAAAIGGVFLVIGSFVLITLEPTSGLLRAGIGSFLLGVGMGFCNTAFIVSIQASVGWSERGMATSSTMFMRIVGNSLGAAIFGAILNFGVYSRVPDAGDAVNRLMSPAARQSLGAGEIARLVEAVDASLHSVYVIAALIAIVSLILALALPARLSPISPRPEAPKRS